MKNLALRIQKYNEHRNQDFIPLKNKALAESAYRFFRGTAHLFYEDFPKRSPLLKAPRTWLCGDLHLENFGSYKSSNRLVYFDINDFDEAYFGPCTLDITRLLTSIIVSAADWGGSHRQVKKLCETFMNEYCRQIRLAHASRLERATSHGIIQSYFEELNNRKRKIFIKKRITIKKGVPRLITDNKRYFRINDATYATVRKAVEGWVKDRKLSASFFKIHDIAFRVAGTGSLGLNRYAVLVEGNGYPQNYILDVKEAVASSINRFFPAKHAEYQEEAARVVFIQNHMQDASSAFLSCLKIGDRSYVLKEHQPSEDKVNLAKLGQSARDMEDYILQTARLLCWAQLRSSGFKTSATADELIAFFSNKAVSRQCINHAFKYSDTLLGYYKAYRKNPL